MTKRIDVGEKAPEIRATTNSGRSLDSTAQLGKTYVVMFFPAVESPGCTLQACQLRNEYDEIRELGVEVFGVSHDSPAAQAAFAAHHRLEYPLISDPAGALHRAFGITRWTHPFAVLSGGKSRSTFVIGPEGRVLAAWYGVPSVGHAQRLLNFLQKTL
ncbi:MAG: hypothetical protein RL605_979 [Actinomycetota bacterium]|jgi:peroxiredoxin Q/BCP